MSSIIALSETFGELKKSPTWMMQEHSLS